MRGVKCAQLFLRRWPRIDIGGALQIHCGNQRIAHLGIGVGQADFQTALHQQFFGDHAVENLLALFQCRFVERGIVKRFGLCAEIGEQNLPLIDPCNRARR